MPEVRRRGLGRGLGALIPGADASRAQEPVERLPVESLRPGRHQPRDGIAGQAFEELVASVRAHGILQPIVARPVGTGYEIVAGERRWRAAREAGLETVPAVVRPLTDLQALQVALVENLQREDLNPVERARAYRRLIEEFGLTQQQVADAVGRSQPSVANALRLLTLPPEILETVERGTLSEAHARILVGVDDPQARRRLHRVVLERNLSVRELADMARGARHHVPGTTARRGRKPQRPDPNVLALEEALRQRLKTQVRIHRGRNKGTVDIEFYSDEDLARICDVILGAAMWGE
ncbi:MAG: ParB/RepB/Spo0J family partition protein [Armatimonadota bacterium]|nr:ParB/RepB/Spo0J family partition protein [Armatimonadota bacterium]MDR5696750.1 ParB/RepB/Spo0J family partition protein [Armatimonadota bacterium]